MFGFSSIAELAFAEILPARASGWVVIDDSQTSSWASVNDNQTDNWVLVDDSNMVDWADIPM